MRKYKGAQSNNENARSRVLIVDDDADIQMNWVL